MVTFKQLDDKYKVIMEEGDNKKLWAEINWSGMQNGHVKQEIPIQVMTHRLRLIRQQRR